MKAGMCASFCLIVYLSVYTCTAPINITADVRENVTLICKVPDKYKPFTAVEWNRTGLDPEYVLLYRDERLAPDSQHPSYKNRVHLQDKDMKDGDFSLNLTNVMKNDTGRYECWVFQEGQNELICNITLEVHPSGDKDAIIGDGGDKDGGDKDGGDKDGGDKDGGNKDGGNKVGDIVGSVVGVIGLAGLGFVVFLIYRQCMKKNPNLPVYPDEAAEEQML